MDKVRGSLKMLVPENVCWLTDGRRTPGFIQWVNLERALFSWQITEYEDKGNHWVLPAERVADFLFLPTAKELTSENLSTLDNSIQHFSKPLIVEPRKEALLSSEKEIETLSTETKDWLLRNSTFFNSGESLDLTAMKGPSTLADDLKTYFALLGLDEIEEKTATALVLNPSAGEWIKGMELVFAENGFFPFKGTQFRTKEVFEGIGRKEKRRSYLIKIHQRIPKKLGVDWSKDITPPFGDSGTNAGIDLWVPASITRTKISILKVVVGKAQIGVNLAGSGKVKVDYQSLYDGLGIDSTYKKKQRTHTLTYNDRKSKKLTTTLPAMTTTGQKKYGYQLSNPRYSWSLKATPGLKGVININAKPFFEEKIVIGPFWFNEFALRLGTLDFKAHKGTVTKDKVQRGKKTYSQPTKSGTRPISSATSATHPKQAPRARQSRKVRRRPR